LISVVGTLFIETTMSSPCRDPNENAGIAHLNERKLTTDAQLGDVEPIETVKLVVKKLLPEIVIEFPPTVSLEPYVTLLMTGLS
jgi:hypothetical protein